MADADRRFRSRKYLLAVWAMALVSVVILAIVIVMLTRGEFPDGGLVIAALGGIGTVLGVYAGANAAEAIGTARAGK